MFAPFLTDRTAEPSHEGRFDDPSIPEPDVTCFLLELPLETPQDITRRLPIDDQYALRATCRQIERVMYDDFYDEICGVLQVMAHPISMRKLKHVARIPRLAAKVAVVEVFTWTVTGQNPGLELSNIREHKTLCAEEAETLKQRPNGRQFTSDFCRSLMKCLRAFRNLKNVVVSDVKNFRWAR